MPLTTPRGNCRHCGVECCLRARRLCHRCYGDAAVRLSYPADPRGCTAAVLAAADPTEAELDALIADRFAEMERDGYPAWWDDDTRAVQRGERI